MMATCTIENRVFSASLSTPQHGVPKGQLAHRSVIELGTDQVRLITRLATAAATEPTLNTKKGHLSPMVNDCISGCKAYGTTNTRQSAFRPGQLQTSSSVNIGTAGVLCIQFPLIIKPSTAISISWNVSGTFSCGTCLPASCSPLSESFYNNSLSKILTNATLLWSQGEPGVWGIWSHLVTGPCSGLEVQIEVGISTTSDGCTVVFLARGAAAPECAVVLAATPGSCALAGQFFGGPATQLPRTIPLRLCGIGFGSQCIVGGTVSPTGSVTIGVI